MCLLRSVCQSQKICVTYGWMDCSVDKELVGRSQPAGSGQQLNVQMDTSDNWCPSGVRTGTGAL